MARSEQANSRRTAPPDRRATAEDRPPLLDRPTTRVVLLTAVMTIATVVLLLIGGGDLDVATRSAEWWMYGLIAAGLALALRFSFHVEYQREAITFTVTESAVGLAIVFLGPLGAIAVRVVVSVVTLWMMRRSPFYKVLFNASLFAVHTAIAIVIVRAIIDTSADDGRLLLAVAVALGVTGFIEAMLVASAIACFEGDWLGEIRSSLRTTLLTSPANAMLAAMLLAPALIRQELVVIAAIPVAGLWVMLRQYGRLGQDHRDLTALHSFSGVIAHSLQLDEISSTAATEVARLLRAERATLQTFDHDGVLVGSSCVGGGIAGVPAGLDDPRWASFFATDDVVVDYGFDHDGVIAVDQPGRLGALALAIRDADHVFGVLIVADRSGASVNFDAADRSRASMLAKQLSPSLKRALLHATMEHAALHDALTGTPNRRAFEAAMNDFVEQQATADVSVMMLDLNRFKEVNDTLGHHVGDRVLQEFAERVASQLGDGDVLARFGGDEFAILVQRSETAAVTDLAERILLNSFTPMRLDDLDVVVTTSIGIAPLSNGDPTTVLRQADIAMYAAKREQTAVEFYRPEIDRRSPERLSLLGSLREALENESIEVHFQPKVDLLTSTVIGAEALARWCHPTRGWIAPVDFINVAEESGLIKQVTDQVLALSIRTAAGWAEAGYDLAIAVNLSPHDLLDEQLPNRISALLTKHRLPAEKLTLEITESALLADTPRTASTIDRLDQLGVKLSLDDFGTGYSSLGYLRRLPVNELKIDKGFVNSLLLDEQDVVIVRSTIDLGHNLGLRVVAEGIENQQTLERLQSLGCDIGQGYGISRPLGPKHFMRWLATTEFGLPKPVLHPAP